MNKKLSEGLRAAFDAPLPKRKNEFLLSINYPKATRFDFILAQIGYIRKRVWIVTLLAVVPALTALCLQVTTNVLGFVWIISSLLPFIALAGITEVARSVSHNMAELEISCKQSLSEVVLARLGIIGGANMIMFTVVITLLRMLGSIGILQAGIYLFIPFLLTCSLSMFAFNHLRSRESVYICGGISCGVSTINAFLSNQYRAAFSGDYIIFWVVLLIALLIWTAGEIIKLIRKTEEYQWNLS